MEFLDKILKMWKKFKNLLLCGRKRPRSDDMKMEDENLFFSIKKRRLSEPKFSYKKINLNEQSLNIGGKKPLSQFEIKEKMRLKYSQADVIFANDYLKQKLKKLQNKNIEEENLIQTEILDKKYTEEISHKKEDDRISINEDNNFAKLTFKKIHLDLESEEEKSKMSNNYNRNLAENKSVNPFEQSLFEESENLITPSGHNDPSYIEIANSIKESDSENDINIEPRFKFSRTFLEKEEEKSIPTNFIDIFEEYYELMENIPAKKDPNNFPQIEYSQYRLLKDYISEKTETNLPPFLNISRESLGEILPGNWLNDEVVNSYIHLIHKRQNEDSLTNKLKFAKVFIFNTYFYEKLKNSQTNNDYSYEKMSKYWSKKNSNINLFDYDYVMIPINLNNSHWCFVTVDLIKKKFIYYDSLEDNSQGYNVMNNLTRLFSEYVTRVKDEKDEECGLGCGNKKNLHKYEEEANKLSTTINSSTGIINNCNFKSNANSDNCESESESDIDMMASFWKFKMANIPKQRNGIDCGVFMCKLMDYLARDELINFTQADINYFRFLMGTEIMEGKMLTM